MNVSKKKAQKQVQESLAKLKVEIQFYKNS